MGTVGTPIIHIQRFGNSKQVLIGIFLTPKCVKNTNDHNYAIQGVPNYVLIITIRIPGIGNYEGDGREMKSTHPPDTIGIRGLLRSNQLKEIRADNKETIQRKYSVKPTERNEIDGESDCIPEFSPDQRSMTAIQWLRKGEQLKAINEWNDVTTVYHMQSRLTGMESVNQEKTFPDNIDYASALIKMLTRHKAPNESMTTYYFEKNGAAKNMRNSGRKPCRKNMNDSYFIDCVINNVTLRGYVDSGCSAVTIRTSDVVKLGLPMERTQVRLSGFGGGSVNVISKVELDLTFLLLWDNHFINHADVVVVVQDSQVRLFNKSYVELPQIECLPSKKVTLLNKETTVIPPHHIGHVLVCGDEQAEDVYVDLQYRYSLRNFTEGYDEVQILQVGVNEDDWVLAAQLRDEKCRHLHSILSKPPQSVEDKECCYLEKSYEVLLGYRPRGINDAYLANEVCEKVPRIWEMRAKVAASIEKQQKVQKFTTILNMPNLKSFRLGNKFFFTEQSVLMMAKIVNNVHLPEGVKGQVRPTVKDSETFPWQK
ncbi:hypothetical protein NQ317_009339 [Molorchus minor]|uniref:Peptidase A2 domain-containing protein n=1 Tax=Molorchus minor TaxID=1323400 RepID=A0ABQ9IPZ0_9CUCU|nr:hypothetical protein NQ317_009339 [Molorchus minor]